MQQQGKATLMDYTQNLNTFTPQQTPQSSHNRPTSAGATRSRSQQQASQPVSNAYPAVLLAQNPNANGVTNLNVGGVSGYIRSNPGLNMFASGTNPNAHLLGSSFQQQQQFRPSSAGHTRPSQNTISGQVNAQLQLQQQQTYQSMMQQPEASKQGHASNSQGHSRPKSAGVIRRRDESSPTNTSTPAPQQYYIPQPSYQTRPLQQTPLLPQQVYNQQQVKTQQQVYSSQQQASARPASANATATLPQSAAAQGGSDHWSTSYKLHYGYSGVGSGNAAGASHNIKLNLATGQAAQPQVAATLTPRSSSAANRIRSAIDDSHKYASVEKDLKDMTITSDIPSGLDADKVADRRQTARDDDDEMDGIRVPHESRSHPEVSTTTPSQSIEFGTGSAVDIRSMDSMGDDNISVGISTVPNQFCTVKEALELKKLLLLSKNSRGGIVPSSTAVMDMYMVGKVVGVGSYGKVRAAWHRLTGSKVAIKTYDKAKLKDPAHWKRVHSEIKIMEQISHPKIARMYEAVETPKRMHLIMECLDGGNLCSYVKQKRRLSEDESKRIFYQILQSIEHLHAQGVSHRDVKLENVLFTHADSSSKDVKLIDFGFSTFCQPGKRLKVFCGTPSYMAPEIVRRTEYEGRPVDIWSLGILLYALLCGCFPFRAKSYPDLYRKIARGTFSMPEELSVQVRDLLRQLLTVDCSQRITAYSAMRHPWLQTQFATAPDVDRIRLETPILISDRPADDIDDQVIEEMDKFGLTKDEMVRLILTKTHSSIATLYYLLLDVCVTRRRMMGGAKRAVSSSNSGSHGSKKASSSGGANPYTSQHAHQPQMSAQQQQQQMLLNRADGDNYKGQEFLRPRSASAGRPAAGAAQRPLSAYAGRR